MKTLVTFLALCFSTAAAANDSIARLGTGGLILVQADLIAMEKEELAISTTEVRVNYVFRNQEDVEKTHLVAFPMPLIEPSSYLQSDIAVPDRDNDNFMNFLVTVNGTDLEPKLEMRALTGGIDVTDRLVALGIPLNPLAGPTSEAIYSVPRDKLAELITMGAIRVFDNEIQPSWTLRSTYYWLQTFPAGGAIEVSHSYKPAVGSSFMYKELLEDKAFRAAYCIDAGTAKAISAKLASKPADLPYLLNRDIQYVLTTGANWTGPIKDFRLTIDKDNPQSVVSFCMDGVTKIGPTKFELRRTDFIPDKDLNILIVEDLPKQ